MSENPKFGSSGVRGIANKEITPRFALNFGLAVGSIYPEVVVGRDPRIPAVMIESAVVAGLLSAGSRVTRIGMAPTPTLAIASRGYDCGIMITASHNPAQYVGIKIFKDGMSFDTGEQIEIEDILREEKFRYASWESTGNLSDMNTALKDHSEIILKNTRRANLKVVVDCGCGAASVITPYVLREMGCGVITLNSHPDGHFPGREPEPVEENLSLLKSTVRSAGADLGIAHDGDADRMMAVDNKGRFVSGDKMLAFFATREARKAIAVPVDTSRVIDDILSGIKISRTKVGDVYVAEELKKIDGDLGGEPSGAWIFPKISLCPDGIYAACRLVELVEEEGELSELLESIPEYPVKRGAFICEDKKRAMAKIARRLGELGNINTLDGVRVDLEEGWILVRPSGTEPKIRITVESKDRCDELYNMASEIVREEM
ncbi:phosphoglucosamine mutase [Candidatus Methanoperedens nitroreducens]|uniref:Phosphoglucosamine mutase n=1 Tax=Candidatus Methanoperedens nitratireducens TaxID=1392998 RepID=A0A062VBU2_9EURY|nr:phosphoglucosamine mutase [Candidatus Methanoperedens nitroreducens]KCZ73179.1 phosphoglucosamine mutase [Candidatus Methanoperedens nitroreducens]MDJ1422872.1 phosphoglucosamine mutase [Candidatus Methanoperedens sp.]